MSGASGLIGRRLTAALGPRYEVVRLVRSAGAEPDRFVNRDILWNPGNRADWVKELAGALAVINLSGEPIAGKRWTPSQKMKLKDSRILTTRALVDAISKVEPKPKTLINASAVGFYGPRGGVVLNENDPAGGGFLAEVCQEWEREAQKAAAFGVRVVNLRTGIVLAKEGGALSKMLPPFKACLGGPLGSGNQVMSWIYIEDEVNAIMKLLEDSSLSGPVNLTAPHPVSMREFAQTLGRVLNKPSCFAVPGFMLKLLLGEMSEMLLTGQNVTPQKLLNAGFRFKFETLEPALRHLLSQAV